MESVFPETCSKEMNAVLAFLEALPAGIATYAIARQAAEGKGTVSAFDAAINQAVIETAIRRDSIYRLYPQGRYALDQLLHQRLDAGADPDALSTALRHALAPRSALEAITVHLAEGTGERHSFPRWEDAQAGLAAWCAACDPNALGVDKADVELIWQNGTRRSMRFGLAHPDSRQHERTDLAKTLLGHLGFDLGTRCPPRWSPEDYATFRRPREPGARALIAECDIPGLVTLLLALVPTPSA